MNNNSVCRRAQDTPGLLDTVWRTHIGQQIKWKSLGGICLACKKKKKKKIAKFVLRKFSFIFVVVAKTDFFL